MTGTAAFLNARISFSLTSHPTAAAAVVIRISAAPVIASTGSAATTNRVMLRRTCCAAVRLFCSSEIRPIFRLRFRI